MPQREDLFFNSQGGSCEAWFYKVEGVEKAPTLGEFGWSIEKSTTASRQLIELSPLCLTYWCYLNFFIVVLAHGLGEFISLKVERMPRSFVFRAVPLPCATLLNPLLFLFVEILRGFRRCEGNGSGEWCTRALLEMKSKLTIINFRCLVSFSSAGLLR